MNAVHKAIADGPGRGPANLGLRELRLPRPARETPAFRFTISPFTHLA